MTGPLFSFFLLLLLVAPAVVFAQDRPEACARERDWLTARLASCLVRVEAQHRRKVARRGEADEQRLVARQARCGANFNRRNRAVTRFYGAATCETIPLSLVEAETAAFLDALPDPSPGEAWADADTSHEFLIVWPEQSHLNADSALHELTGGTHTHLHNLAVSHVRLPPPSDHPLLENFHAVHRDRLRAIAERFEGRLLRNIEIPLQEDSGRSARATSLPDAPINDPLLGFAYPDHHEGPYDFIVAGHLRAFDAPFFGIDAFRAWEQQTDCSAVPILMIDSGVDVTHPDLRPNLWVNAEERVGKPGVDDDHNGFIDDVYGWNGENARLVSWDPESQMAEYEAGDLMFDRSSPFHGTQMVGLAAAVGDNGIGSSGVCQKASVISARWRADLQGTAVSTLSGFLYAMEYALVTGVRVINQSQSWYCYEDQDRCYFNYPNDEIPAASVHDEMAFVEEVVQKVIDSGVLFFTSFGNSSKDMDTAGLRAYPQDLPGVQGVGGSLGGSPASFSNFGSGVAFAAPSGSRADGRTVLYPLTTISPNSARCIQQPSDYWESPETPRPQSGCYIARSGTSMASALVAASAALVWSANPTLTSDQVLEILRETGSDLVTGAEKFPNANIVNVGRAVEAAVARRTGSP